VLRIFVIFEKSFSRNNFGFNKKEQL